VVGTWNCLEAKRAMKRLLYGNCVSMSSMRHLKSERIEKKRFNIDVTFLKRY